ncbi:aldehyde dehydrogenase family protein [Euzebya sp.]|uniref:aldehyde dehydrogenase family protein n=1 Tax=Euzebya sp. TaxID=1971409 RepID=UPI0035191CFF
MSATLPTPAPLPAPLDVLDAAALGVLPSYLTDVAYADEEVIVTAGEEGDGCLFLDSGVVRLEAPLDHLDTEVTLGYLEPGDVLGELSVLDAEPRSATAVAEGSVTGRWLTTAALDRMLAEEPTVGSAVLRALARDVAGKLRETNQRLTTFLEASGEDPVVEAMVAKATSAQQRLAAVPEATMDAVLADLADVFAAGSKALAAKTVEVTHIGRADHKAMKNAWATRGVYDGLAGAVGRGVLGTEGGVTEIAAPVGVIFALIPVTNPVATAVFKVLSALKSGNAIILSFHRVCLPLADDVGGMVQAVLARHGVPADAVQWVRERASRQRTARFMAHPDVSLILATGGPGMVRAAYSSGTPAIGVGSGNAPCWVATDADLDAAAGAIVISKSFDNGLICGAEHNLVVDAAVVDGLCDRLAAAGAAVLDADETARFLAAVVTEDGTGFRPEVLGQSAATIAGVLVITRDHEIQLIAFRTEPDLSSPVTSEKMSPFLPIFTVDGDEEALALSLALLDKMGAGHTAIVHTTSTERADAFAAAVPASRILVNSPGSQGVCGLTSGLAPSLTLGCGTFGGNSTTDNVTYTNLRNVKRVATFQPPRMDLIAGDL